MCGEAVSGGAQFRAAESGLMAIRHFIDLADAGGDALRLMLDEAKRRRDARTGWPTGRTDDDAALTGHTLAMIFEKSSTRTRLSFEQAIKQLGGTPIVLQASDMQLGRGETIADTACVLSRMVDAIMIRTDDHAKIVEMAAHATVPVINGLTDRSHPCQLMADVLAFEQHRGPVAGTSWAWLGDGNNVAHSLIEMAAALKFSLKLAVPEGYDPDPASVAAARAQGCSVEIFRNAIAAVSGVDAVVTDTWISMGQKYADEKLAAMLPFQVTPELMRHAKENAVFLHCLPAHRGEEVLPEVIDGPQSIVWDEAECRLHAQKAILLWCLGLIG
jgi:ornithine carbamoyltransferase